MRQKRWGLVLAGILVALAVSGPGRSPDTASAAVASQDAARGGTLYVEYGCYQCHGRAGQGAPLSGPRLAPNLGLFESFARQVWEPRDIMPPYAREFVTERDIADMYAWLEALPPPPRLEDVPLLNP